jgi:hypothetical protein
MGNAMRYAKWTFWVLLTVVLLGFLHYTLPQRDIVRIVNTEVRRVDFGGNSIFWSNAGAGDAVNSVSRDVLFIETVRPGGKVIVFRNEDTGFGWPPYFKFSTANLQTEAADAVSTRDDPDWYSIRHYGWRSELISIFPNAVSLKPVAGPDVTQIPWFNIVFLILMVALIRTLQVRIRRWWRRIRGTDEAA